jgi:PH (Pleckstrin Homology) domain-containing protein/putative oligomerization/nucleic acid binding protein
VARYADTLLADGERIALRRRQHFLATIVDGRAGWALVVLGILLIAVRAAWLQGNGALEQIVGWGALIALVIGLLILVRVYWNWYAEDYIVTNRRVLKVEGILNKRSADSSLEKINDAVLEQNIFGRLFGYGDLDILTAADVAIDRYRMLAGAPSFKKAMLDQKHSLEMEVGRSMAPAMRAPSAPSAPAMPAPAPARTMSADEVTTALGNLADLRDRGAISLEEYEAKKAELLGRL